MTDKEIIEGLAHCFNMAEYSDCNECPYRDTKGKRCTQALYDDVLDLINRQQSQIEILEGQNRSLISEFEIQKNNFIHLQERYDDAHKIVKRVNERFINKCKELKTAKTTTIQEFAEKLKRELDMISYETAFEYQDTIETIDNLVKEMAGAEYET